MHFVTTPASRRSWTPSKTSEKRRALVEQLIDGWRPDEQFASHDLDLIRANFRNFTQNRIAPLSQQWHLNNDLIPDEVVYELATLGTFGVNIDPCHGGLGLGHLASCVVSEELSRGWLAADSLVTRSEIVGSLIGSSGTPEQKNRWLPRIADGSVLPVAAFSEPNAGSDLASTRTRARQCADGAWEVHGSKTWTTHASRGNLMAILARSDPSKNGWKGLSILLAEKARGTPSDPFPDEGLAGAEIPVLGYRG